MITIQNKWDGTTAEGERGPTYIDMTISPDEGDLIIEVNAPFYGDAKPPQANGGRFPKLWEHEVVELFIVSTQAPDAANTPYLEFIVGPHGHWLILGFPGEGRWDECDDNIMLDQEPIVTLDPVTNRWNAVISFPCQYLPEPECDPRLPLSLKWLCNAFAMHGAEPNRSYLACYHVPGDAPNFHQLKFFQPLVLFESDPNRHPSADLRAGPYETIGPSELAASLAASHLRSSKSDIQVEEAYDVVPPETQSMSSRPTLGRPTQGKRRSILDVAEENRIPIPPSPPADGTTATASTGSAPTSSSSSSTASLAVAASNASSTSNSDVIVDGVSLFDEKYLRHLHEGEFVVLIGRVWKRKGWSYKKRILILSSKPRLLYINYDGLYKGSIQWTMTTPITVKKVSETHFDISLHDNSRCYHFNDESGSTRWVNVIGQFLDAWKEYLDEQRGITKSSAGYK